MIKAPDRPPLTSRVMRFEYAGGVSPSHSLGCPMRMNVPFEFETLSSFYFGEMQTELESARQHLAGLDIYAARCEMCDITIS